MSSSPTPFTPLAIVGIGCLFPKSDSPGTFWANVKSGIDCITEVPPTHWNPDDYFDADPKSPDMTYARRGGFLSPVQFNPLEFGIAPRDLEATDTSQLLGLVTAKMALEDAKVRFKKGEQAEPGEVSRAKTSVILGVTGTLELVIPLGARLGHPHWKRALHEAGVADDVAKDVMDRISDAYVPWQENSFPGLLGNVVAGRIANKLDLHGTNCVVDAACASSLSAVHLAAMELATGKADVVVTGGVDTFNDIFMFMCFSKTPALAKSGDSKPFDANGDGTILGEGLGMVVLKRLSDAERDGDRIYATIRGIGTSSDGKGNAIYAPSSEGQKRCLLDAYQTAKVSPETVELLEAHGTGTKVGDATEATALADVYSLVNAKKLKPWCALGSVKSQIGHTKAAAGSASLIKAALALYHKVLPPTIKVSEPVEPLRKSQSPFYVNTQMRPWLPRTEHPRRAALSAFGFGGSNFHAVLEEHGSTKPAPDLDNAPEILALSGDSANTIEQRLSELGENPTWASFTRAAHESRSAFEVTAPCRLVLVARSDTNLAELLRKARQQLTNSQTTDWHIPGAYFGQGANPGQMAVLFPGQGSQYVGMLRDLSCTFPEFLELLEQANRQFQARNIDTVDDLRLTDRIYPPSVFDAESRKAQEEALRATQTAQPALGAVSLAAWQVLHSRFGIPGEMFAGHSYGELVALAAAGRLTAETMFHLSQLRGQLMAEQAYASAGAMSAVLAPVETLEKLVQEHQLTISLANKNSPKQTVISGTVADIERAEAILTEQRIRSVRLPVAAAFHSPLVSDAAQPFRAALEHVPFTPGTQPVYANTTGTAYPDDDNAVRDLLGYQLANSVEFTQQITRMIEAGASTFLEVGPGSVLSKLVKDIATSLGRNDIRTLSLDANSGKLAACEDLAHCLARLAAIGIPVNLAAWQTPKAPAPLQVKPGLLVPICGANRMDPRPKRPIRPITISRPDHTTNTPTVGVVSMNTPPHSDLQQALQLTQQTLAALQQIQQQTAQLHQQFLESQERAQSTLHQLVHQQQNLLFSGAKTVASPMSRPVPPAIVPPPTVVPPRPTPAPTLTAPVAPAIVPPPAPTPVVAPVSASPSRSTAGIEDTLLAVVAEKTGYPQETLSLDMALDADLGVDSIKRVEILSALQDKLPNAPVIKPEHLGTLNTLRDVAEFLQPSSPSNGSYPKPEPRPIASTVGPTRLAPLPVPDAPMTIASPVTLEGLEILQVPKDPAQALLEVVAEKTGYPQETLSLDMALDADLGVDSIKRVEILSALQDKLPNAPVIKPEHLGTLNTLRDVALFLTGRVPSNQATTTKEKSKPVIERAPTSSFLAEQATPKTETVSEIRAPILSDSMLNPAPKDGSITHRPGEVSSTGTRTGASLAATEVIDRSILQTVDIDPLMPRPKINLTQSAEIWLVAEPNDAFAKEIEKQGEQLNLSIRMFAWEAVTQVMPSGEPYGLILLAPERTTEDTLVNRLGFQWTQAVGTSLRTKGRNQQSTLLISVTRMDGSFGIADSHPEMSPHAGGLAGLIKTARFEWPDVNCKAIDINLEWSGREVAAAATALLDEILIAGPVEVGLIDNRRSTPELVRTVRKHSASLMSFGPQDVLLITGGGRGVTAEVAVALAESFKPTLILTGRTALPTTTEPEWLMGITDEVEMKKAIANNLGVGSAPKVIGEQFQHIQAVREIRQTIERIERFGSKVLYIPTDVTQPRQVADLLQQIHVKFGSITGVVHGAGVLADKRIEDLTVEQFDRVYATKVHGLQNLLEMLDGQSLKTIMVFSSTTARFGRVGQAAYAVANEVLNKIAQVQSERLPECRVVAINWGPWDGGMVTPQLRKVFETEGVGVIPLAEGAMFALQELNTAGRAAEVIALGKLKIAGNKSGNISSSSVNRAGLTSTGSSNIKPASNYSTGLTQLTNTELAIVFERGFDLNSHSVLRSHIIDGRAVLPMVLHMETLAHAALHGNPGLVFHGFNDLRITNGVMIEDGAVNTIRALAGKAVKQDKFFHVPVEIRGRRRDGRDVVHSRAEVILCAAMPKPPVADRLTDVQPYPHPLDEIYRYFLFHGKDLHGIEQVEGVAEGAFLGTVYTSPQPQEWIEEPLRSSWVSDPLSIDASFQMMILWSYAQHGAGSLPCFAGRYRQYRRTFPSGVVRVALRITRDNGSFARANIDYLDVNDGSVIAQIQDYECVIDPQLNQAFRRNQLLPSVKA